MHVKPVLKEVYSLIHRGQIDLAVEKLSGLSDSEDPAVHNLLGDLHFKRGRVTEALSAYRKAAGILKSEGHFSRAKALYRKILNVDPSDWSAEIALGDLAAVQNFRAEALRHYLNAAKTALRVKSPAGMTAACERAISVDSDNHGLLIELAGVLLDGGLPEKAVECYARVADLKVRSGDLQGARDLHFRALSVDPARKATALRLSELLQGEGDFSSAIEVLQGALREHPGDRDILCALLRVHLAAGNTDEVLRGALRLAELYPSDLSLKVELARLMIQCSEKEKAWGLLSDSVDNLLNHNREETTRLLEELSDVIPEDQARRLLGSQAAPEQPDEVSAESQGNTVEQAVQDAEIFIAYGLYEQAMEKLAPFVESPIPEVHLCLRKLHLETGDRESAARECLTLSELLRREGRLDEAEAFLNEAKELNPDSTLPALVESVSDCGEVSQPPESITSGDLSDSGLREQFEDLSNVIAEVFNHDLEGTVLEDRRAEEDQRPRSRILYPL